MHYIEHTLPSPFLYPLTTPVEKPRGSLPKALGKNNGPQEKLAVLREGGKEEESENKENGQVTAHDL